jgi:aryl-alcohol dehydrogenase-like predicted oxidoreductase
MENKICIGTMLWGTHTSAEEAHNIIYTALDNGVDFFDTAQRYPAFPYVESTFGLSEKIIGDWNRSNTQKIKISTKLYSPITPNEISFAVDSSLQRLGVDTLDYCHLHWPNREHYHFRNVWNYNPVNTNTSQTLEYFDKASDVLNTLKQQGKIKNICMSNETAWGVTQWNNRLPLHSVQQEYSLLHRLFELDVAEACHHNNVKLLAWTPLAGGLLTGKYTKELTPPNSRRSYGGLGPRDNDNVWAPIEKYNAIAMSAGMTLTHMSIAWVLQNPLLEAVILGATNTEQLMYNLNGINELDSVIIEEIQSVYKQHPLPF